MADSVVRISTLMYKNNRHRTLKRNAHWSCQEHLCIVFTHGMTQGRFVLLSCRNYCCAKRRRIAISQKETWKGLL